MKKILIVVLIILLIVLSYFCVMNGIEIGNLKVLSFYNIKQYNDDTDVAISDLDDLITNEYTQRRGQLDRATKQLEQSKQEYLDLANLSTESEIEKANQREQRDIDFLQVQVGGHATANGVNMTMEVSTNASGTTNSCDLSFTAIGQYISIMDFVYAIENDSYLNFRIENFRMVPYTTETQTSVNTLQATFTVRDVGLNIQSVQLQNSGIISSDTTTNTSNNTQANTTTTNTTNTTKQ